MAKRKVIAVVFSDLHLNLWAKHNNENIRTLNGFDVLFRVAKLCDKYSCPSLFCGDLFHKPENMDQELYGIVLDKFHKLDIKYPKFRCFAISGNHCLSVVNHIEKPASSWVTKLSTQFNWLVCVDCLEFQVGKYRALGIPYIDHNTGIGDFIKDKKFTDILMLHSDFPGAQDTDGRAIDSTENLSINNLKGFKLVLMGHIHKPQRLGKKIYMIGAPQHQRRTDRNCNMGYWLLYSDLSMKFKTFDNYPKFIDVESETDIKDDGNYYTVVPKASSINKVTEHKITKQLSKKQLARRYMKQNGQKNSRRLKLLTDILNKSEQC